MCLNVAKNLEGLEISVDVLTQKSEIIKHRFIEEKRSVHLLRVDEEPSFVDEAAWSDIDSFLSHNEYSAIVISDYNKGYVTFDIASKIAKSVAGKIPIFVDTKKQDISCFSGCILKINKEEKNNLKKLPLEPYELIVTLGEDGAMWNNKIYPTKKSKLFDVCGAGDTFLAGLVFNYIQTSSLEDAILFANKCASISVNYFGNFVLSLQDVS
jgi:bifunctional ADP-heptose synthase (sugar kinase/adenylyltransferase)